MTTTPGDGPCEPKIAVRKYETLRANALGDINRAADFTLFLRHGMSAWLRALQDSASQKTHKEARPFSAELDMDIGVWAVMEHKTGLRVQVEDLLAMFPQFSAWPNIAI